MYMLNMVIILIVMYCNVVTAIDKIPTYLLRFNSYICRLVFLCSFVDIGPGFPARPDPYGVQCSVKSGIALAWDLEAADSVQAWLPLQTAPDASTWGTGALGASLHLRRVVGCYCILHISVSDAISIWKFTIRIALYVRCFGCCLGKRL